MTHVSSDAHSSVESSHTKKQVDKSESQSEMLFDNLFSLVSELDLDSVNYINQELQKNNNIKPELKTKTEDIENSVTTETKRTLDSNLVTTIETIYSILNDEVRKNKFRETRLETKESLSISPNSPLQTRDLLKDSEEVQVNKKLTNQIFSQKLLAYTNLNPNFLGKNNVSSATTGAEKLDKVVKLIEQVVLSKRMSNSEPQTITNMKTNDTLKVSEISAFDKAIEVLHEIKKSRKTDFGPESTTSLKKGWAAASIKNSLDNKNGINTQKDIQTILNQTELSSASAKTQPLEVKVGTLTRQVELSHQISNNSASQTNTQINSFDMNSWDSAGEDGNENQQLNQQQRASSPLNAIHRLNMADKAWKEALVRQVERQLKEGNKTLDITLNPKQLGRMTVSINVFGDDASVQIFTETSGAASILLESENKLAQMMQDIGLRLNLLQASLSGKQNNDARHNRDTEEQAEEADKSSEDKSVSDDTNVKNIDNSILNIVA